MIWEQVIVLCICAFVFVYLYYIKKSMHTLHLNIFDENHVSQLNNQKLAPGPPMRDRLVGLRGALAQTLPDQLHLFRRHMLD